jgi:hypothetical protein
MENSTPVSKWDGEMPGGLRVLETSHAEEMVHWHPYEGLEIHPPPIVACLQGIVLGLLGWILPHTQRQVQRWHIR